MEGDGKIPGENGETDGPTLPQITRRAARRWRLERTKAALSFLLIALAIASTLWALVATFLPSRVAFFPQFALLSGAALLGLAAFHQTRRVDVKKVHRNMDRRLGLPDLTLSAGELSETAQPAAASNAWIERQRAHTLSRIASRRWNEVWPTPWPRWSAHAAGTLAVLFPLLGYLHVVEADLARVRALPIAHRDRRATAFEDLFKDWEEAEKQSQGEDRKHLKELLEKIAPLRERLATPQAGQKQLFSDLNRVEEIVAAEKARLEAQSLEPNAGKLADSLEPLEGMSPLAAAIRRKDFENAEQHAKAAQEKLEAPGAAVPKGARPASEAGLKLARELEKNGQQAVGRGLGQLYQGARQNDPKAMAKGMRGLADGLARQNNRDGERRRLALQLAQLGLYKERLGEGKSPGLSRMPSLASLQSKKPGKGAGSEKGSDPFGDPTHLQSERRAEALDNTVAEGESETTVVKTAEGHGEAARATASVSFREYEQLSRQAIEDENIPAAHRQAIKQYFERIRPDAGK